jgi:hypothetical protein
MENYRKGSHSGNITDEVIKEYIRLLDGIEPSGGGDNFQIGN